MAGTCPLGRRTAAARTARQAARRYLDEGGQQDAAHLLLQDHLVLAVVVTSGDERREQHFDQPGVAEVLEGQLAQLLQHRGVAAGLHDDLGQGSNQVNCQPPAGPAPFPWASVGKNHTRKERKEEQTPTPY